MSVADWKGNIRRFNDEAFGAASPSMDDDCRCDFIPWPINYMPRLNFEAMQSYGWYLGASHPHESIISRL